MFYRGDTNGISVLMELDAVVADPEPEFRRFNVLETLNIAFASSHIMG